MLDLHHQEETSQDKDFYEIMSFLDVNRISQVILKS